MNISLWPCYLGGFLAAAILAAALWALARRGAVQRKTKLAIGEPSTHATPAATTAFIIILGGAAVLFLLINHSSMTESVGLIFRLILIASAAFFPAMLYFLFISARRQSLFNTFTTYLGRLGLLRRWWTAGPDPDDPAKASLALESPSSHRRRLRSYLDRFGAVYGSLPDEFCDKFLDSVTQEGNGDVAGANLSSIFRLSHIDSGTRCHVPHVDWLDRDLAACGPSPVFSEQLLCLVQRRGYTNSASGDFRLPRRVLLLATDGDKEVHAP
jgi:hypothetical protein